MLNRALPHLPITFDIAGQGFTVHQNGGITCDRCRFPLGNVDNSFAMLLSAAVVHAERHAERVVGAPAYIGDSPTPADGWFASKAPQYQGPDAFLIVAHGHPLRVETDPNEATVTAAGMDPDGARVLGPLPLFADFTDPVPPAALTASKGLRALPPVGPFTTAEMVTARPIPVAQLVDEPRAAQ